MQWTRAEEFMWAYFRPAALIEVEAGLDAADSISAWDFTNYNSGASAIDTPYRIPNTRARFMESDSPLRQSSYRCLAATANNFARESFTDELAEAAGKDPLEFRLAHLDNERLRNVLTAAAERFGWAARRKQAAARSGHRPGVRNREELGGGGLLRSGSGQRDRHAADRSRWSRHSSAEPF